MRLLFLIGLCFCATAGAVVLDRIAVVVGRAAIKESDIEREIRLTQFLNRDPLKIDNQAKKAAADRLIDQQIIRKEIATGSYARPADSAADEIVQRMVKDRFGGSEARLSGELQRYALSLAELRRRLLWQLTVVSFIQQRFQGGGSVSDQDEQKYYNDHLGELKRDYPGDSSFATLEPVIHQKLAAAGVNSEFDDWLDNARKKEHIEYHEEDLR